MVQKWRKKPVVIEAIQWSGENKLEILAFCGRYAEIWTPEDTDETICEIHTMEGIMTASVNDYIIKGLIGEFYPCKPNVFEKTYDLVEVEKPSALEHDNDIRQHFVNK
jgi:hypothetical protein